MIKQSLGIPEKHGPHVLYMEVMGGYMSVIGSYCEDCDKFHTTHGVIDKDQVVAYVGPLPEPEILFGRLRN